MKRKSFFITAVSCFLICLLLVQIISPAKAIAEEGVSSETVYIKEIVTDTGKTAQEAKNRLIQNGYTVLDSNLNAGTDEAPVYLGYKTTLKKSEAITDISLMNMSGGYELMDYTSFAEKNQANIQAMTAELKNACVTMKEKLQGGSAAAQTALGYLNIFTVPEKNLPLGDYLLAPDRTDADYRMILLVCNSLVTNIIYTQLSLGCIDYQTENWIERLSAMGPDETFRDEDFDEYWQQQFDNYYSDALDLYRVLGAFREKYLAAQERRAANGGEIVLPDATQEEAEQAVSDFAQSGIVEQGNAEDAFLFSVMEYLNRFSYFSDEPLEEVNDQILSVKPQYESSVYFDGTTAYYMDQAIGVGNVTYEPMPFELFLSQYAQIKNVVYTRLFPETIRLGDALMEIASGDEEDEENISLLYPMVKALSPAQKSLLCVEGLTTFTKLCLTDEAALDTLNEKLPEYKADLLNALESDTASVWIGTNRAIYESKIALTNQARRNAAAANDYEEITHVSDFDTDIKVALCYIGGAAAAVTGVTLIVLGVGSIVFKGAATVIVAGLLTMGGAISTTISGVAFGCVSVIGIAVSAVVIAALVVCAIVYAVDYFIDLYNYYHPDYTEIPSIMIDTVEGGYVTYHAVTDCGGKNADINVWEGKKWNALYYTKDSAVGSPLIIGKNGLGFRTVTGSNRMPEGTVPVKKFGTKTVVNLNGDDYDDDVGGIYLYFYTEEKRAEKASGSYLESLTLLCHEEESVVRNLLRIKGYEVLDYNLTSDTDYATFLGYTTTSNPDNAITDIRVSYAGSEGKYYYGDSTDTYGFAGSNTKDTEGEATDLLLSLYYTKSKKRGTPILANLLVSQSAVVPQNYEPVNLFSGGGAFDFNIYPEEDPDDWGHHSYLFFEPSVKYNASNSTPYLGGIAFVSGSTDMSAGKLTNYVKELGMTLCDVNLTNGFTDKEDRTWLCYSTTYNPYRAIYDIGVYTAEYKSNYMPENLVLDGVGYISCQTFTQGDRNYYGNIFWGGHYRLIRTNHAYITKEEDFGGDDEYGDTLVCNRAMYVCGPEAGKAPIKISDFHISKSKEIPAGCIAVHDMTDKYAAEALNLALFDNSHKNSLYITYPGTVPVKQKYISAIRVVSSAEEDFSYDQTMYQLMASGGDEIIKINLAELRENSWHNSTFAAGFDEKLDLDDYEDAVAYIRLTRTKVKNDAIGSVALVQSDKKPAATMQMRYDSTENTASFSLAGDKICYCGKKSYYLYYAKNGNKISEFTIDKNPVVSGRVTVLDQNRTLASDLGYYFHTYSDVSLAYYSTYSIVAADSELNAIKALLAAGCTDVIRVNQSSKLVMLGYAKTSSAIKAIKNVVFSTSNADSITVGGMVYTKCGSFNGTTMYSTADGLKAQAITYFSFGSSAPGKENYPADTIFECVQNDAGKQANIASSVGRSGEYYLFVSHKDGKVFMEQKNFASIFMNNSSLRLILLLLSVLFTAGLGALIYKKKKRTA